MLEGSHERQAWNSFSSAFPVLVHVRPIRCLGSVIEVVHMVQFLFAASQVPGLLFISLLPVHGSIRELNGFLQFTLNEGEGYNVPILNWFNTTPNVIVTFKVTVKMYHMLTSL